MVLLFNSEPSFKSIGIASHIPNIVHVYSIFGLVVVVNKKEVFHNCTTSIMLGKVFLKSNIISEKVPH